MNPNRTEIVHTSHAGAPIVAEMAPIENRTRAGTPAAMKNASFHPMARCMPYPDSCVILVIAFPHDWQVGTRFVRWQCWDRDGATSMPLFRWLVAGIARCDRSQNCAYAGPLQTESRLNRQPTPLATATRGSRNNNSGN